MRCVVKLGVDLVPRITGSGMTKSTVSRVWAAALNHESRNDAVKLKAIVIAFGREFLKVCDVIGGFVREKPKDHVAPIGLHNDDFIAG